MEINSVSNLKVNSTINYLTMKKRFNITLVVLNFLCITIISNAQGPGLSFMYNPLTEFSFASCYVYLEGGAKSKIPFMPVTNEKSAPSGTDKYSKDVKINAPIVFVGNGIVKENVANCYKDLEVKDKVVLFCYDFPDTVNLDLEKEINRQMRIEEAARRGASAIVAFSMTNEYPLFKYKNPIEETIPEVPIIAINKISAENIISSSGYNVNEIFNEWEEKGTFKSMEIISKLSLFIKGKFDRIESENFTYVFREEVISRKEVEDLIQINESSVEFLLELLGSENLNWSKSFVAYFRDFDTKLFYVSHWGWGLANESGAFMFYDGKLPDYSLAVHENMHTLIYNNWGKSSSFMVEALGKYAEAKSGNDNDNHLKVIEFLKNGKLKPLNKLISINNIGGDPFTEIAYPVSGSFIEYLINTYGMNNVKQAYQMENQKEPVGKDTWVFTFGESLESLEKEWLFSIAKKFNVEESIVKLYLNKSTTKMKYDD